MPELERLEIPDESRTVKAWFQQRPADVIVREIKQFIRDGGEPHLWRGHTHTPPPDDARPVYLEEFDLPEKYLKAKRFAPCPCCHLEHRWYGRDGKIAWFEAEGVIRLIGPDCFKKLNAEVHEQAVILMRRERAVRRGTEFLLANHGRLPEVIETIERAIVVSKAFDIFHDELHYRLELVSLNLWAYARREGELTVYEQVTENRTGRGGETYTDTVDVPVVRYRLPGFEMLDPRLASFTGSLETALRNLRSLDLSGGQAAIDAMADDDKIRLAGMLSRNVANARDAIAKLETIRQFIEPVAINTLRAWGEDIGCPIPWNYSLDGARFCFGKSDYNNVAVPIPNDLRRRIGAIDFWANLER